MMVETTIQSMTGLMDKTKSMGKSIGFVPTMGALHHGHMALVKQARKECDVVVCSIFVNPIQFDKAEDLNKYPRTLEKDLAALEQAGCDVAFCPEVEEMYPKKEHKTYDFGLLDKVMEGRFRKGHFNGVAIVVKKLIEIITPDRAYFGEKDYQQLQVVKTLVRQENLPVQIIGCPTIREADGLALSSRNVRLNPAQRREAPLIFQSLRTAKELFPEQTIEQIKKKVAEMVNASPELEIEYFEIVDADTLEAVTDKGQKAIPVVGCIAVKAGGVRLIDNLLLNA